MWRITTESPWDHYSAGHCISSRSPSRLRNRRPDRLANTQPAFRPSRQSGTRKKPPSTHQTDEQKTAGPAEGHKSHGPLASPSFRCLAVFARVSQGFLCRECRRTAKHGPCNNLYSTEMDYFLVQTICFSCPCFSSMYFTYIVFSSCLT